MRTNEGFRRVAQVRWAKAIDEGCSYHSSATSSSKRRKCIQADTVSLLERVCPRTLLSVPFVMWQRKMGGRQTRQPEQSPKFLQCPPRKLHSTSARISSRIYRSTTCTARLTFGCRAWSSTDGGSASPNLPHECWAISWTFSSRRKRAMR